METFVDKAGLNAFLFQQIELIAEDRPPPRDRTYWDAAGDSL